jgi:hypothetical protein
MYIYAYDLIDARGVRAQNCWAGVAVNPRIDRSTSTKFGMS